MFANESLDIGNPLQTARTNLQTEFARLMGESLPLEASSFLVEVDQFYQRLQTGHDSSFVGGRH